MIRHGSRCHTPVWMERCCCLRQQVFQLITTPCRLKCQTLQDLCGEKFGPHPLRSGRISSILSAGHTRLCIRSHLRTRSLRSSCKGGSHTLHWQVCWPKSGCVGCWARGMLVWLLEEVIGEVVPVFPLLQWMLYLVSQESYWPLGCPPACIAPR